MTNDKDDLTSACRRLTPTTIASLLSAYVDEGWSAAGTYAKGPCPVGVGGCVGDPRAAYAYPSTSGWAPWVRCHHRSCGYQTSIFDMLADRLGGPRAVEAIKAAADGGVSHANPATATRTKRPLPTSRDEVSQTSGASAAAEELERRFPSGGLVTRSETSVPVAAIVISAAERRSKKSKKPMLVLELGLISFEGDGRAPMFLPESMPTYVTNTLRALAPEVVDSSAETLDLDLLLGREAIAHVQLEVGEYGPRTKVGYLSACSPGLVATPELVSLIIAANGGR
ncbi:MAG: hypothetical protein KIT58_02215 [Planctomycetota bacterium]|nr:hypothetical protein [Planctomycetota bacterium]